MPVGCPLDGRAVEVEDLKIFLLGMEVVHLLENFGKDGFTKAI